MQDAMDNKEYSQIKTPKGAGSMSVISNYGSGPLSQAGTNPSFRGGII